MKIIYYDYGGAHSTVTAANIHLGRLPCDRRPNVAAIIRQPFFDEASNTDLGQLRHLGADERGNDVYVLALTTGRQALAPALLDFLRLVGVDTGQVYMHDSMSHVNILMRVGGFLSRWLGVVALGRPMVALGVWLQYHHQCREVARIRRDLGLSAGSP